MSSMNPSAMLAESLAEFSKAAYSAFTEIENKSRQEVARAQQETRDAKAERDNAIKKLHAAQLETRTLKQDGAATKATLAQAELTVCAIPPAIELTTDDRILLLDEQIAHQAESLATQVEQIAQLRREVIQWKDQSRNWQEHFLRVEQERCAQSSRLDELVVEKLQFVQPPTSTTSYITPKHSKYVNQISSAPSMATSKRSIPSPTQPPAYRSAGSSAEPESSSAETLRASALQNKTVQSASGSRTHKPSAKSVHRERDTQSEVQEITPPSAKRARKSVNRVASIQGSATTSSSLNGGPSRNHTVSTQSQHASTSSGPNNIRSSTVIRRVHAVVRVKREDDSEEGDAGAAGPSGKSDANDIIVKKRKKEESIEGAGQALLNSRRKGTSRGRSRSKRVISEDEGEAEEEGPERSGRRGTDSTSGQEDDDEEEERDSAERSEVDKTYNLRKPSRPNYREDDQEDDEEEDELMMGAEDNHDEVYGSYPVNSSRQRLNGSPRKKRKFSAR